MGGDPSKAAVLFRNPDNLVPGGDFPIVGDRKRAPRNRAGGGAGKGGEDISVSSARPCVRLCGGARHDAARPAGRRQGNTAAWEVAKAFGRRLIGDSPASAIGHPSAGAIWLDVNGARRQSGDLNQLIWKVPEAISYLSKLFRLAPGDLIFTGTPAGVGAVKRGDALHGHVDRIGELRVSVV
jgi:fumarylpyruvate hydrolase